MAEDKKIFDAEYVRYMNEMGDLLGQVDGKTYDWNDVATMEKRLLEGQSAPTQVKKETPVQPVVKEQATKPHGHSKLGLIVSGFADIV